MLLWIDDKKITGVMKNMLKIWLTTAAGVVGIAQNII